MHYHKATSDYQSHASLAFYATWCWCVYLIILLTLSSSIILFSSGNLAAILLLKVQEGHFYLYTLVSLSLWLHIVICSTTRSDIMGLKYVERHTLAQINTAITPSHFLAAVEPLWGLITGRQGWLPHPSLNKAGKWQVFLESVSGLRVRTIS